MKKKILSIIIAAIVVCTFFTTTAFAAAMSGTCGENAMWEYYSETKTLTIRCADGSKPGVMDDYDYDNNTALPPWVVFLPDIQSISIEDGIQNIGNSAFHAFENLKEVKIPESVTSIGEDAFNFCINLENLGIPNSVTTIGENAFRYCSNLKSITLSENIKDISNSAFFRCKKLESVTIPENVTSIEENAFFECININNVNYLGTDEQWKQINIARGNNCLIKANATLTGACGANAVWEFDNNRKALTIKCADSSRGGIMDDYDYNDGAAKCPWNDIRSDIKTAVIEDGIHNIGDLAFLNCIALETIDISSSVRDIGAHAFSCCLSLKNIEIPEGVTGIGESAFYCCQSLKSIEIPGSVKNIEKYTFWCSNLESVTINEGVIGIGEYAFYYCEYLKSIEIPGSVRSIGEHAFYICASLKSVKINEGVRSIGEEAFGDCVFLESIIIPKSVTSVGRAAFWYCHSLKSVTIPSNVKNIEDYLFFCCNSLESVVISEGVTKIGDYALGFNKSLRRVAIPKSVKTIGEEAFQVCDNLGTIYYFGTQNEWNNIQIVGDLNTPFEKAKIRFNSKPEDIENLIKFTDVPSDVYYADAVSWAVNQNITVGTGGGNFSPDISCSRANIVTFLWRAAGCPEPATENNPFTDVKEGEYYYKAVLWAVENGVTLGISDTQFGTDAICARDQIVTFLWRAKGSPAAGAGKDFDDVPENAFYAGAVNWAVENGITLGVSDTQFAPGAECSRAQCVTFLYRAFA